MPLACSRDASLLLIATTAGVALLLAWVLSADHAGRTAPAEAWAPALAQALTPQGAALAAAVAAAATAAICAVLVWGRRTAPRIVLLWQGPPPLADGLMRQGPAPGSPPLGSSASGSLADSNHSSGSDGTHGRPAGALAAAAVPPPAVAAVVAARRPARGGLAARLATARRGLRAPVTAEAPAAPTAPTVLAVTEMVFLNPGGGAHLPWDAAAAGGADDGDGGGALYYSAAYGSPVERASCAYKCTRQAGGAAARAAARGGVAAAAAAAGDYESLESDVRGACEEAAQAVIAQLGQQGVQVVDWSVTTWPGCVLALVQCMWTASSGAAAASSEPDGSAPLPGAAAPAALAGGQAAHAAPAPGPQQPAGSAPGGQQQPAPGSAVAAIAAALERERLLAASAQRATAAAVATAQASDVAAVMAGQTANALRQHGTLEPGTLLGSSSGCHAAAGPARSDSGDEDGGLPAVSRLAPLAGRLAATGDAPQLVPPVVVGPADGAADLAVSMQLPSSWLRVLQGSPGAALGLQLTARGGRIILAEVGVPAGNLMAPPCDGPRGSLALEWHVAAGSPPADQAGMLTAAFMLLGEPLTLQKVAGEEGPPPPPSASLALLPAGAAAAAAAANRENLLLAALPLLVLPAAAAACAPELCALAGASAGASPSTPGTVQAPAASAPAASQLPWFLVARDLSWALASPSLMRPGRFLAALGPHLAGHGCPATARLLAALAAGTAPLPPPALLPVVLAPP